MSQLVVVRMLDAHQFTAILAARAIPADRSAAASAVEQDYAYDAVGEQSHARRNTMCDTTLNKKSVLVFQSSVFDASWNDWREEDASPPLPPGRDVACYLASRLREKEVTVILEPDDDEEHGDWELSVAINNNKYNLTVSQNVFGRPPVEVWIVQVRKRVGCIGVLLELFGNREFENVRPVCEVLDAIVKDDPKFTDVKWLTFADFISQ